MEAEYKIIGGDGREYGPASLDELKSWIQEGRVAATTLVWCSEANTWQAAAKYPELQSQVGPPPSPAPSFVPVGFLPRLAAYLIDQFLLGLILYLVWVVFLEKIPGWEMPKVPIINTLDDALRYLQTSSITANKLMFVYLPIFFVYEVVLNGRFGATLGKMVIGARVVHVDISPIGYKTAAMRWLGERVSDFICYAGYLLILFRPDRRALHDLIAGTRVIYRR